MVAAFRLFISLIALPFLALAAPAIAFGPVSVEETFLQDSADRWTAIEGLDSPELLSIAVTPESVVVAGPSGLARFVGGAGKAWETDPGFEVRIVQHDGSRLWAAGASNLALYNGLEHEAGEWSVYTLADSVEVRRLGVIGARLALATNQGLLLLGGDTLEGMTLHHEPIHAFTGFGGRIYLGTDTGLYSYNEDGSGYTQHFPSDSRYSWAPQGVTALAAEGGRLWFGCAQGAGSFDGENWTLFTGAEGLPYDHFTCAAAKDGVVWFGTERGALRYDGDTWAYRANRRWLPDDRVTDIDLAPDGSAWIATRGGASHIALHTTSLAQKAAEFERIIDLRHRRGDFVVRSHFENDEDFENFTVPNTDNDGLYTAMYGASQAFRYGVSKDPEAKERAKRVFRALELLEAVTPISGFPARSIMPADADPNPNKSFSQEANIRMKEEDPHWKLIHPRWPTSSDGKYLWKCDTSSDEICGHYFFYGVYYDLVAETEEERAEVRELVKKITDHLVDNDFRLVDYDGLPTRWGNWSPGHVNSAEGWADRGLQSLEMLSFLSVANHITSDTKYLEAARLLREEHKYHVNAISGRQVFPPNMVVPWDNNLSFLSYYGLLKYEKDSELLDHWRQSIDRNWLFVSKMNDPFFNFVNFAVNENRASSMLEGIEPDYDRAFEGAVRTLRQTPQLLLAWEMNNSHRLDVLLDPTPGKEPKFGWSRVTGEAIPIDERCHIRINSDHQELDHGRGGGKVEYEGTFYLLPYYMGLYHGFLK